MKERYEQLDALRGLAALTVLFSHLAMTPANVPPIVHQLLYRAYSPFNILIKGHQAVFFFFVLSGFVLSLPLLRGSKLNYSGYLIRRFCRIYIPYIIAFGIGLLLLTSAPKLTSASLADIINNMWTQNLSTTDVLNHVYGIVSFDSRLVNGVIWTLVHEMRISIVFPFVVLLLMNVRWYYSIAAAIGLSAVEALNFVFHFQKPIEGLDISYFDSLHFLSFFILGMVLAQHRHQLANKFRELSRNKKIGLLLFAFVCYNYSVYPLRAMKELGIELPYQFIFGDYMNAVGIGIFITAALSSRKIGSLLTGKLPIFLGNVSYSLYLYHLVIMLALIHHFLGKISLASLLGITLILSLLVAYLGYVLVEKPSIVLGKKLTQRIGKKEKRKPHSTAA